MNGLIFSTEEFSVYDGPGIRTTVFLKGCPLRCIWCHNPEGQNFKSEILRSPNGCINCGACEKNAEKYGNGIIYTTESVEKCPKNLLRICGENMTAEELSEKLMKNKRMMDDGGVTFSGGEPLAQVDFLCECLELLHGKLHTAVQTSGYCDDENFMRVIGLADYFLYDLKIAGEIEHIKYTGVSNKKILTNFLHLAESGKDFIVRIPLIPDVTDTESNIEGICGILKTSDVKYAELLPYNRMAGGKYKMLGRNYLPGFDETKTSSHNEKIFESYGISIKIL